MGLERIERGLVNCVPVPDWVDHQPYRSDVSETDADCVAGGACRLLSDIQVDLGQPELAWHFRNAQRVLTREGAERVAQIAVEFDPRFQRLDVHFVRLVRDGERVEHAKPEAFELLRRETKMERLAFDGRLTASLLLPDVRVGDLVEICVTVYGSPPVLARHFASWVAFDHFNPWFETRYRLVRPQSRNITVKLYNGAPEPAVSAVADKEDARWQIVGQKRQLPEPLSPPWRVPCPTLQISEFESWNDVVCLLAPFYEDNSLPEPLAAELERLAATYESPAERAVEWLRFVQRNLRYFALSLGEGGLTPRSLEVIWSTKFGDCKDAARLYVAGARQLGLDACAALVSTTHGFALDGFLPSSDAFNHCIVRLRLEGTSYWLDPTAPVQSGNLQAVFQPHVGSALPLVREAAVLEVIGSDEPVHAVHWDEEITIGSRRSSPATVRRRIDYSSWLADSIRNRIANEGVAGFSQTILKETQRFWPGAVETSPIEIHDDQAANKLTLVTKYDIHDCWKSVGNDGQLGFPIVDWLLGRELQPIGATARETEIFLGRPRRIYRCVHLRMPCGWRGGAWQRPLTASQIDFIDRLLVDGRNIIHSRELTIKGWTLPGAEADKYAEITRKVREDLLTIAGTERFGRIRPLLTKRYLTRLAILIIWYAVCAAFVLYMMLRS